MRTIAILVVLMAVLRIVDIAMIRFGISTRSWSAGLVRTVIILYGFNYLKPFVSKEELFFNLIFLLAFDHLWQKLW